MATLICLSVSIRAGFKWDLAQARGQVDCGYKEIVEKSDTECILILY